MLMIYIIAGVCVILLCGMGGILIIRMKSKKASNIETDMKGIVMSNRTRIASTSTNKSNIGTPVSPSGENTTPVSPAEVDPEIGY